jgi:aspartyl-tRNA(Asn)/glutamyl-tRNA(Gln) amidotransferase subunit B
MIDHHNKYKKGILLVQTLVFAAEFDRKNYFYPDIPKGYQISQYERPLVSGGELLGVAITRVHLEEDTARSQHAADGAHSLVDFNRAGVPLMELVTEPVITSAQQAAQFGRELQLLLRYLGASETNMEKGEMRVEANVSLNMGTKVEVKNLNSFRAVERAIEYELKRQQEVLERGEKVVQETRGWDEGAGRTFSQRQKESSHDYRYFPDPDLPPLHLPSLPWFKDLKNSLPELPAAKRDRYRQLGFLQEQDIEQLVNEPELAGLFDEVGRQASEPQVLKLVGNLILNFIVGLRRDNPAWPLPRPDFLVKVVTSGLAMPQIKSSILSGQLAAAADASTLDKIVAQVLQANEKSVTDYKAGKTAALQALIGQAMKLSQGAANPEALKNLLLEKLG